MIGRPDVIEELNFDYRFHASHGKTDGPPDDVCLGKRGIVYPISTELSLQSPGDLENSAFPFHVVDMLVAGNVGDILPENDHPRISCHFVAQTFVQQVDHRRRISVELRVLLGVELFTGRIDRFRIDVLV